MLPFGVRPTQMIRTHFNYCRKCFAHYQPKMKELAVISSISKSNFPRILDKHLDKICITARWVYFFLKSKKLRNLA